MSNSPQFFTYVEICNCTGLPKETLYKFIEREWICPDETQSDQKRLDDQDLARIHLILDLQRVFGANDEAIPVILHLLDQIYHLRSKIKKITES